MKEFSLVNVINTLHDVGFADADWEHLGIQLKLEVELSNIR